MTQLVKKKNSRYRYILGIESSCDETAAAVLRTTSKGVQFKILSDVVYSQVEKHQEFGGVVPEIAARAHCEVIDIVIKEALEQANIEITQIDAVAATAGPGLIGGVMVGLMTGKALAQGLDVPFIGVNHLEGHALSPMLSEKIRFPYLLLLISGGHCQFLQVNNIGDVQRLGSSIDDAVGECFDKVAAMLGLGFPGGPSVENAALSGDAERFQHILPRPLLNRKDADMSFSGLKTAMSRLIAEQNLSEKHVVNDLCAAFQYVIGEILVAKTINAMKLVTKNCKAFVVAGGVAANSYLRNELEILAEEQGFSIHLPPMKWCTDNAAMIALAGAKRHLLGLHSSMNMPARARWPLDEMSAVKNPIIGAGRKGAKV